MDPQQRMALEVAYHTFENGKMGMKQTLLSFLPINWRQLICNNFYSWYTH